MTVVVDLGCGHAELGLDSISLLVDRFKPEWLYGFDPHPSVERSAHRVNGCPVFIDPKAAWLYDGVVDLIVDGHASCLVEDGLPLLHDSWRQHPQETIEVPCFDFAAWLRATVYPVVLKMDIEGAEGPLLKHILATGADKNVAHLIVEWHGDPEGAEITARFSCPTEIWDM